MKKYTWISLLFIAFLVLVVYLVNIDAIPLDRLYFIPHFDKVAHFTLFGLLAFFVNRATGCRQTRVWGNVLLTGSLWIVAFVALEEFSQMFIATRSFDISDFMYDLVGIYLGGFVAVATARPLVDLKLPERAA